MANRNDGEPKNVVLAHSDAGYRNRASGCFRKLGWDVICAGSGAEARRIARNRTVDLIVLDAGSSGESGWLVCQKLTTEQPETPVILVSSRPTPELSRFACFVGAAALVSPHDNLARAARRALAERLAVGGV